MQCFQYKNYKTEKVCDKFLEDQGFEVSTPKSICRNKHSIKLSSRNLFLITFCQVLKKPKSKCFKASTYRFLLVVGKTQFLEYSEKYASILKCTYFCVSLKSKISTETTVNLTTKPEKNTKDTTTVTTNYKTFIIIMGVFFVVVCAILLIWIFKAKQKVSYIN